MNPALNHLSLEELQPLVDAACAARGYLRANALPALPPIKPAIVLGGAPFPLTGDHVLDLLRQFPHGCTLLVLRDAARRQLDPRDWQKFRYRCTRALGRLILAGRVERHGDTYRFLR